MDTINQSVTDAIMKIHNRVVTVMDTVTDVELQLRSRLC